MGACKPNERGVHSDGAGTEKQLGGKRGSGAGGATPAINSRGKAMRPNVRNVDRVDRVAFLATAAVLLFRTR